MASKRRVAGRRGHPRQALAALFWARPTLGTGLPLRNSAQSYLAIKYKAF